MADHSLRLIPASPAPNNGRPAKKGVLPSQDIRQLVLDGHVHATQPILPQQIQPASLDLRLGRNAHRLQASFLPGSRSRIETKLAALSMAQLDISQPTILEKGCVYLIELMEALRLPRDLQAKANPKSTTGRLDIFTRLITEYGTAFERIQPGYSGPLYAEIMPKTFPIVVRSGLSLSQVRFIRGDPRLSDRQLKKLDKREQLVYFDETNSSTALVREGGIEIAVSLACDQTTGIVAYRGKNNAPLVDLEKTYSCDHFWDTITGCANSRLILNPGDFYILASREKVRIPLTCAAEMVPFDPSVGEFRIHYAGFFDPGFGYGDGSISGTPAVLEVRAHEAPFVIEHGQVVGRLVYSHMIQEPDRTYGTDIGSSYQRQELALSRQFRQDESG